MLKKKGNKKDGYTITRAYTKGHQKITEPLMTMTDGEEKVLTFSELELLSESVALGAISEEKFIVYEIGDGSSVSILNNVVEFHGLNSFEQFFVGVDLIRKEYVIFRKLNGCPLERLKGRIRDNQFITGENIMLFKCNNKLKMLNFNCDKLRTFDNLVLLRGTLASIKSNWVLNTETGVLYKTTTPFKFEDVVSLSIREPYIIFELTEGTAFAYMKAKDDFNVVQTFVTEFDSSYRFKEFHFEGGVSKRGLQFINKGVEFLHFDGNVYQEGSILHINKKRYKVSSTFELVPITGDMIRQANKDLKDKFKLSISLEQKSYFVQNNVLCEADGTPTKASHIPCEIFDDVSKSEDLSVDFILNDYLLQQYTAKFTKEEFTKNFSTPLNKVAKTLNGLSELEQGCLCKTLYPRLFKNYFVFVELTLQKTIVINLNNKELPRRTDMEFVMPTKNLLIGVKEGSFYIEVKGLRIKCDFVKFTPEGILVMGYQAGEHYAFAIKDNGNIHEITEEKFITTDYYIIYNVTTWKNAYAKSLPTLYEDRKKLGKLDAF